MRRSFICRALADTEPIRRRIASLKGRKSKLKVKCESGAKYGCFKQVRRFQPAHCCFKL
jgi:hypothetical protein